MATIDPNTQKLDEDQQNTQATGQAAGTDQVAVAPTIGADSAATVGATAPVQKGPTSSGRFTNLQKYLTANKPTDPSQSLAAKIGGNLQTQAQGVSQNLEGARNAFQAQAGQNVNSWKYDPSNVNQALTNPVATVADPNASARFAASRDANYTGPQSLADLTGKQNIGALNVGLQNVQAQASQTGNEAGRFNLLGQMFGRQGYSQGQQKLDNLLIQGDKNQLGQLQKSRSQASQLNREMVGTDQSTRSMADQYSQQAKGVQGQVRQELAGTINATDQGLVDKAKQLESAKNQAIGLGTEYAKYGALPADQLERLGMKEGTRLYDVNLANYLTPNKTVADRTNVAGAEDYARMAALGQLAGGTLDPSVLAKSAAYVDPKQAATFDAKNPYTIDKAKLDAAIAQKDQAYQKDFKDYDSNRLGSERAVSGDQFNPRGLQGYVEDKAKTIRDVLNQRQYTDEQVAQMSRNLREGEVFDNPYKYANDRGALGLGNEALLDQFNGDQRFANPAAYGWVQEKNNSHVDPSVYMNHRDPMVQQLAFERAAAAYYADMIKQLQEKSQYGRTLQTKLPEIPANDRALTRPPVEAPPVDPKNPDTANFVQTPLADEGRGFISYRPSSFGQR